MKSTVLPFLSLFLVLATLSCPEAAPSTNKSEVEPSKAEQLVRVYPINEEQYERLLKLTNGKNVISEARLTSAGFTSVRNSLDSGWNSLLRIMGLTTTSRAEVAKIDIDGQPLCVMRRSMEDTEPRGLEARDASEEENVINCIVVLKKDRVQEPQAANPSFAPYWFTENNTPVIPPAPEKEVSTQSEESIPEQVESVAPAEEEEEELQVVQTTPAPKIRKVKSKPKSKSKSKSKSRLQKKKTSMSLEASRQIAGPYSVPPQYPYGSSYGVPPQSPYASSWGSGYPYGGYPNPNPFENFNLYPDFSQFQSYAPPPYPSSPYPPSPFSGYYNPYDEESDEESEAIEVDEDDEDDGYEVYEVDGDEDDEYYK